MKLEIQKLIVSISFSDYAKNYKEAGDPQLCVWVNIPRAMLQKRAALDMEYQRMMFDIDVARAEFHKKLDDLQKQETEEKRKRIVSEYEGQQDELQKKIEEYTQRNYEWFVEIWSQGPEGTTWTVAELFALQENDHMLLGWMADRTRELLQTRRVDQKKS